MRRLAIAWLLPLVLASCANTDEPETVCAEGELEELWSAAGLAEVRGSEAVVSASYTSFEDPGISSSAGSRPGAPTPSRSRRSAGSP